MQVKMLKELKRDKEEDAEVLQSLEDDLLKEYPSHLPLLSAILASFTSLPAEKQNEHLQVTSRPALTRLVICTRMTHAYSCNRLKDACVVDAMTTSQD